MNKKIRNICLALNLAHKKHPQTPYKLILLKWKYRIMTEGKEVKNPLQTDFEEAIAEKNKTIYKLEQERDSALSARAKMEKTVDDLKAEKAAALDKAERAEARYLRNTELKTRSESHEKDLLNKLFGD